MREYKFRGKRPFNGEWVYGFLIDWKGKRPSIFVQNGDVDEETGDVDFIDYTVDPETVGQYIGRCDKNGNELYEKCKVITPVFENKWGDIECEIGEIIIDEYGIGIKFENETLYYDDIDWDKTELLKEVESV